jgi:hypothetical protein
MTPNGECRPTTILRKRENYRRECSGFDQEKAARYKHRDRERLLLGSMICHAFARPAGPINDRLVHPNRSRE